MALESHARLYASRCATRGLIAQLYNVRILRIRSPYYDDNLGRIISIGSPEAATGQSDHVDVTDASLLAAARTRVPGEGWEVVEAIDYAWAWRTLEVIFKRRQ